VAQKNHHIKLFQANALENVPPGMLLSFPVYSYTNTRENLKFSSTGTVVDTKIVHPRNYDFYMCTHVGMLVGFPI
jgi:eukaryotic translation initiation factor 2C